MRLPSLPLFRTLNVRIPGCLSRYLWPLLLGSNGTTSKESPSTGKPGGQRKDRSNLLSGSNACSGVRKSTFWSFCWVHSAPRRRTSRRRPPLPSRRLRPKRCAAVFGSLSRQGLKDCCLSARRCDALRGYTGNGHLPTPGAFSRVFSGNQLSAN